MPDLDYVIIVGRFGIPIADGADLDDDPDMIWCDAGEISLEPLVAETKVVDGSPVPWTGGQSTFTPTIDAEGYSTWRGQHFIKAIDLTSTKVNPRIVDGKATHRVTFRNVKAGVLDVKFEQRSVRLSADMAEALDETAAAAYGLPAGALVCDLTRLLPVPVANSVPIVVGPQGPAGPNSIPTDEFMAEKADDSTSEFGTAMSRKLSRVSVPDYASGTFSFNPETSVYGSEFLMTNSREKFSTAAARGGTYKIAVIGDSLSSGYLTSQQYSWPALMSRSHLPSRNVEVRGERINLTAMNGTVPDPRLSYAGSWDFGQQALGVLSGAGSATAAFTNPGTVVEVKVQGNAASSYDITIDGGTPITVSVPGDFAEHVHTVAGLPDAPHTVQASWVSGSWSPASILCGYDTGVDVYNAGVAGSSSDDWTGAPTYQVYPVVTSAPDLVVISLMYGDFFASTSPADFKANLLTTIGLFPVGTDFLLVGEPRSSTVPISGFEAYLTALYELANTGALPLLDLNHAWRNTDMDSLTGADHLHLNDAGTSAFARAVSTALSGAVAGLSSGTVAAAITAALPARQTLDDLVKPFHYLHGVGSVNGLPLDPAGTLVAVENAIAAHPSDLVMVDLDYRRTRDSVLVSAHDATTGSASDANVTIAATAFRDLPDVYKPGLYGSGYGRVPIASHEAILSAARGRAVFSIEIKDGLSAVPDVIALTNRLGMADSIVWNTGDPTVVAALVGGGLKAFMFNCTTTTKLDQAKAAGAWMVDVPTDASTALIDHAIGLGFAHVIRGFVTTAGTPQATDSFAQLVGMDSRLSAAGTDATGYLDRPGGATLRSADSIAGAIRTGKRGPGWRLVNSSNLTDWLAPGRLYTYKAGSMVYTFGNLAGTPYPAGVSAGQSGAVQTITAKIVMDTLPTTLTQSTRLKLYSPTEAPANASANTVEGYVVGLQADGLLFLNSVPVGGGTPAAVFPNIQSAPLVAATEATVTCEIDDRTAGTQSIRITRQDAFVTLSSAITAGTITSLPVTATPAALANGAKLMLADGTTVNVNGSHALGVTSITVTSIAVPTQASGSSVRATSGWVNETTGGKAIWRGRYHSAYTTQTTGVGALTDLAVA